MKIYDSTIYVIVKKMKTNQEKTINQASIKSIDEEKAMR